MDNKKAVFAVGVALLMFSLVAGNSVAVVSNDTPDGEVTITKAENDTKETVTVNGTLQSLEGVMTAWMYGTHILVNNETGERYALQSDSTNLTELNGEEVRVSGELVHEGIDTGPPLVDVENVESTSGETPGNGTGNDSQTTVVVAGILLFVIAVAAIVFKM